MATIAAAFTFSLAWNATESAAADITARSLAPSPTAIACAGSMSTVAQVSSSVFADQATPQDGRSSAAVDPMRARGSFSSLRGRVRKRVARSPAALEMLNAEVLELCIGESGWAVAHHALFR